MTGSRVFFVAAIAALFGGLSGCGGPIDPERPPKYDYEFESPHGVEPFKEPKRI